MLLVLAVSFQTIVRIVTVWKALEAILVKDVSQVGKFIFLFFYFCTVVLLSYLLQTTSEVGLFVCRVLLSLGRALLGLCCWG